MRAHIAIEAHGQKPEICYVVTGQGPAAVWRKWKDGGYSPDLTPDIRETMLARGIRWGAYGDPAALPSSVFDGWAGQTRTTGYTHQWRDPASQHLRGTMMASANSVADAEQAAAMGWRVFRVIPKEDAGLPLMGGEVTCPAAAEAGAKATCRECGLCNGAAESTGRFQGSTKPRREVPQGVVLYEGPSMLDGEPIVAIATGMQTPSTNRKTGEMVQVHILLQKEHPSVAQNSGADSSICGNCPLRPLLAKMA